MAEVGDQAAPTTDATATPTPAPVVSQSFEDTFKPQAQDFGSVFPDLKPTVLPQGMSSEQWGNYLQQSPVGRIISAFGEPFTESGLSEEADKSLREAGIFQPLTEAKQKTADTFGQSVMRPFVTDAKIFNEYLLRPAITAFDYGIARPLQGLNEAIAQGGQEIGDPDLGRDIAGGLEMAETWGHIIPGGGFPHAPEAPRLPPAAAEARAADVIGGGDELYMGTRPPTDAETAAQASAVAQSHPEATPQADSSPAAVVSAETTTPPTVDNLARQAHPELFKQWDGLQARRDTFTRWLDELSDTRATTLANEPPAEIKGLNDQISELERKSENAGARLQKRYSEQLQDLTDRRDSLVDEHLSTDTGDMAVVRRDLQKVDFQMRDMAEQVSAANREAATRVPQAPELTEEPAAAPQAAPGAQEIEPAQAGAPTDGAPQPVPVAATQAEPGVLAEKTVPVSGKGPVSTPEMVNSIKQDVFQKLISAGRPTEESSAAAEVVAAHYEARAQRFEGALGTAKELYDRESPQIRIGQSRDPRATARAREFAQDEANNSLSQPRRGSITFAPGDGRAIIKLFKDADASTFMHESGHQWLEDLMRDAVHPQAPADLQADAATVRKWLGADETAPIKRAQHEKFARGFERYLMEGRAPSQALARVFGKFKQWLTEIYQTVAKLRSPINEDIRHVFDRLLSKTPERATIAPELPLERGLADTHEGLETKTLDAGAEGAAHGVDRETADEARAKAKEIVDELRLRRGESGGTAGGGTPQRSGADGGVASSGYHPGAEGDLSEPRALVSGVGSPTRAGFGPPQPEGKLGPTKKQALYAKVPKRPPSFADWIKARGGLKDDKGEVKALGVNKPGLIKPTGESIDDLALAAWEHGFFPETQGERPTYREFLAKLADDLHGNHQWSDLQDEDVGAYKAAVGHNAEVDEIASRLQIEQRGLSHEDFWNTVADRMSVEERAKEIHSMTEAGLADAEAVDKAAGEFLAIRGEAWEPEAVSGAESRSLEDLENERRSEETARDSVSNAPGGAAPGPASASAATSEGQPGQAGRGAGTPSGGGENDGGAATAEPKPRAPRGADDPLIKGDDTPKSAKDLIGNIRGDLLNIPTDVDDALRQIGRQLNDFESDRFGPEGKQLYIQIASARILVKSLDDETNAARVAAQVDKTPENLLKFQDAANRLTMAARRLSIITHGWGLAGHAFRQVEGLPEYATQLNMAQLAERTKGMTLDQLANEVDLLSTLDTPAQRLKLINDTRATRWDKARSMIIEYFVNSLISGPITHQAYTIGNEVLNLFKASVEIPVTAAISAIRGREVGERVYLGEVKSLIYSHTRGAADGWAAAQKAWKTGVSQSLPGDLEALSPKQRLDYEARRQPNTGAIPGKVGEILRLPTDSVAAIHSFGRGIAAAQEMWRLAYRSATDAGLEGDAAANHIAQFIANPPDGTYDKVNAEASRSVLMQRAKYGTAFWHLKQITEKNLAAKIIAPFMQIGANLLHEGFIERSPIGLLNKDVRDNLAGRNGGIAQDMQMGKMVAGIGLSTAVVGLTLNGVMSGGGPSSFAERRVKMATGWQPYALQVNGRWIPFRKFLGALGPLVAGVADVTEIAHNSSHEDLLHVAASAVGGLAEVIADESWFSGVSNFINAARNYDKPEGERYLRNLATDFIPFSQTLSQTARLIDPYSHSVTNWVSAVKSKIPVLSEQLPPSRDILGDPIASHLIVSPTVVKNEPVLKEMQDARFFPTSVGRHIKGVPLTDQQYDDYAKMAGGLAKFTLRSIIAQPQWAQLPAQVRHDEIQKVFRSSRIIAANAIMLKSIHSDNDIMAEAAKHKKEMMSSIDEP